MEEIDPRKYYTANQLQKITGINARVLRVAPDLPRLHIDKWARINGQDFLDWLAANKKFPQPPDRERVIRERVAAEIAKETESTGRRRK